MAHSEFRLFTLINVHSGIPCPVEYWGRADGSFGYGVVCPRIATTNGSYRFLVGCIKNSPSYTITPGLIAPESMDEWHLLDPIREWLIQHTKRPDLFPRLGSASWS